MLYLDKRSDKDVDDVFEELLKYLQQKEFKKYVKKVSEKNE